MELESLDPRERLELLSAYLDGELPADEAREVTAWLERHPEALREVERQRRLWDLLGRYADEPVPAGFSQRVLAQVPADRVPADRVPADRVAAGRVAADRDSADRAPHLATPHIKGQTRLLPRRAWALAAAALVLATVGAGIFALRPRGHQPEQMAEVLAAIDPDFVQHADLERLVSLSDAQFEALLVEDPDALADATLGNGTLGG
jgi:anti-sigma factor RsiW